MRPVNLFRSRAPVVLAVSLALAGMHVGHGITRASRPHRPARHPRKPSPSPTAMAARPTPTPTPLVGNDQSPVSPAAYAEMPVVLEMTFRLRAVRPGRMAARAAEVPAVFRRARRLPRRGRRRRRRRITSCGSARTIRRNSSATPSTTAVFGEPPRTTRAMQTMPDRPGSSCTGGPSTRTWTLTSWWSRSSGMGPPTSTETRSRTSPAVSSWPSSATLLSNFEAWAAARGYLSTPYDPGWYTAAIVESFPGDGR